MRILVIEDNHRLNSSLASNLAHEGYSAPTTGRRDRTSLR